MLPAAPVALACKLIAPPAQTVMALMSASVTDGTFTVTCTVLETEVVQLPPKEDVATTVYSPAFAAAASLMVGFCSVEVKLLGPLQL